MKGSVKIKQRDITDCGAACLASIAAFHNLKLAVSRIRQLASTDKKGTNILGLIEAANKLGFDAKGVRGEFDSLFKIPKPAIAHVIVKEVLHHYVVIYNATPKYIEAMVTKNLKSYGRECWSSFGQTKALKLVIPKFRSALASGR